MNRFYVVLGDWSSDGHGKSVNKFIESNVKLSVLEKAYKDSVKKTGIDFEEICQNYDDNSLPYDIQIKFIELGCPLKDILELDEEECQETLDSEEDDVRLDDDSYIKILMWFVGLSVEGKFEWKDISDDTPRFSKSFEIWDVL